MSGGTYKLIELVGTSKESFEDAVNNAVKESAKTIKNLAWLEVVEQRGHIANGEVSEYQVKVKISFKIER
ncbi:MAG TPA: dodecin [Nitrospinota bacterium]|nr:dodecin [Nitrospinota bacterium]